ncbi:MAG: tetratricopeptide repeat protein [Alphaproteobacteria bacterium GM7ARS4]|nr:tetratricopeptide repeat protein [Alphaproteobacteria bacterium GM7ARS4]
MPLAITRLTQRHKKRLKPMMAAIGVIGFVIIALILHQNRHRENTATDAIAHFIETQKHHAFINHHMRIPVPANRQGHIAQSHRLCPLPQKIVDASRHIASFQESSGFYLAMQEAKKRGDLDALTLYQSMRALSYPYRGEDLLTAFYSSLESGTHPITAILAHHIHHHHALTHTQKTDARLFLAACAFARNTYRHVIIDPLFHHHQHPQAHSLPPLYRLMALWHDHTSAASDLKDMLQKTQRSDTHTLYLMQYLLATTINKDAHSDKHIMAALSTPPILPLYQLLYAQWHQKRGQEEKATRYYRDFAEKNGGSPWKDIIDTHDVAQQHEKNLSILLPLPPSHMPHLAVAIAAYHMAAHALERNQHKALLYARIALMVDPSFAPAQWLIITHLQKTSPHLALPLLQKLTDHPLWDAIAMEYQALAMDHMGQYEQAINILDHVTAQQPTNVTSRTMLAELLFDHGRYAQSLPHYDYLLNHQTDATSRSDMLFERAVAYDKVGEWEKAEQDLLEAIQLNPLAAYALNYLGYSWVEQDIHHTKALQLLRRAMSLQPHDGFIIDSYGWALYKVGQYDKALTQLKRAILLNPEEADINEHLGDVLWKLGRHHEAIFQWQRAFSLSEEHPATQQRIKEKIRTKTKQKTP